MSRATLRITAHFAPADVSRARVALKMVGALGVPVTERPLVCESDDSATGCVAFVFLSDAIDASCVDLLKQCCLNLRQSGVPVQLIKLDSSEAAHGLVQNLAKEVLNDAVEDLGNTIIIDAGTLSEERLQLRLAKIVLERLDQDDPATSLLPRSLVISYGSKTIRIPQDFGGLVTIGRGNSCDIVIESDFASRMHGCFRTNGTRFSYRDMSSNGTVLLEGHEEVLLHDTEANLSRPGALRIGGVSLNFSIGT